jgi:hypothetical protein
MAACAVPVPKYIVGTHLHGFSVLVVMLIYEFISS